MVECELVSLGDAISELVSSTVGTSAVSAFQAGRQAGAVKDTSLVGCLGIVRGPWQGHSLSAGLCGDDVGMGSSDDSYSEATTSGARFE